MRGNCNNAYKHMRTHHQISSDDKERWVSSSQHRSRW